jgi:hypothetical protein
MRQQPKKISPSCCRQTSRPFHLLQTPAIYPFMISPSYCRQTSRPFHLLQTPAICPFMISPSCCRQTSRPFHLLQTPAICPFLISPSYCRQTLRPFHQQRNQVGRPVVGGGPYVTLLSLPLTPLGVSLRRRFCTRHIPRGPGYESDGP